MMKLRRLRIQKYRFVKPGTELHFHSGVNLLLGLNGTGKTTLLDLVARVIGGHFGGLREEEFALDYDLELPEGLLEVEVSNERAVGPSLHKERVNTRAQLARYSYRFTLAFHPTADRAGDRHMRHITWDEHQIQFEDTNGYIWATPSLSLFDKDSAFEALWQFGFFLPGNSTLLLATLALGSPPASRLDESLDWLRSRLDSDKFSVLIDSNLTIGHVTSTTIIGAVLGPWLSSEVGAKPKEHVLSAVGADLPVLVDIASALGHKEAALNLELLSSSPSLAPDSREVNELIFGKQRFYFTKHDGSIVPLEHLSFGQKRMVALIYYLAAFKDVIIADELGNGLHHAMISDCFRRIGGRQAFLATQNPLLLDFVEFKSAADVRASLIRCSCDKEGTREQMVWGSLTEEEASEVFADYSVGIQHSSEILKVRGLW